MKNLFHNFYFILNSVPYGDLELFLKPKGPGKKIVKGLVEIITKSMSGHTKEEIKDIKHNIVDQLGLGPGLTVRRQVGMMAMIDHIKKITGSK